MVKNKEESKGNHLDGSVCLQVHSATKRAHLEWQRTFYTALQRHMKVFPRNVSCASRREKEISSR